MNELGLGVVFEAKDLATGTMGKVSKGLLDVVGASSEAGKAIKEHFAQFTTGLAVMGAGLAGLAMLAPTVQAFSDFQHQLGQIRTVISETALSTQAADAATRALAATYGGGPIAQAKGLYEVISAGVTDATKAVDLLSIANEFAIGGDAELAAGVDILTSSVNTYADSGLTAKDASDSLFIAIAAGKTNARELSATLGNVTPTAKALGVSFDELTSSIAALTVQGIKTPMAVTGLNAVLANIAKPTADATAEARRLGIQFDATALKTKGLIGTLGQLAGNAKINNNTFVNLFGSVEGMKTALALTAGEGAKVNEIMAQMAEKGSEGGATHKAFVIMSQTLGFQTKRFDSLKESVMSLIGESLEPAASAMTRFANTILEAFTNMPDGMRNFLVQGFALVSTLLVVVGGAIAFKAAIALVGSALSAVGVSIGSVIASVAPMLLLIGAIALAVYGLHEAVEQNVGGIGDFFRNMYEVVSLTFEAIGQLFEDGGFSGEVLDQLESGHEGVETFAISIYLFANRIIGFFQSIGEGLSEAFGSGDETFQAFSNAIMHVVEVFSDLYTAIDPAAAEASFDGFTSAGKTVGHALGAIAKILVDIFTIAIDIVAGFLSKMAPVGDMIGTVIDVIGEVFVEFGTIISSIGEVDGAVGDSASGWIAFGQTLGNIVSVAASLVKSLVLTIGNALKGALNIIGGVLDLFTGHFERGIQRILYGIVSLISGVILGAIELVATASDALLGTNFAKSVGEWRKSLDSTLKEGFGLEAHKFAAGSEEERLDNERKAKEAKEQRDFYAPDAPEDQLAFYAPDAPVDPLAFYAPDAPPAAVAAAADAGSSSVDVDALNASVAALTSAKEGPTTIDAEMTVDGEVLGKLSVKAARSAASDGQHPVSIMFDP